LESFYPHRESHIGEEVFRVEDWSVWHPLQDRKMVSGANFNVRAGEVVGIAGLMGAGRTELAMSIFGRSWGRNITGRMFLRSKEIQARNVAEAIDNGVAYATEDRKKYGLNLIEDIRRNISAAALSKLAKRGWVNGNEEIKVAEESRKAMNIKAPSVMSVVGKLSGGNQQKVVLSKWLFTDPELLILDEPMNGLDPAGIGELRELIRALVAEGRTVLLSSHQLDEVERICDAAAIVDDGKVIAQGTIHELTGGGPRVIDITCDHRVKAISLVAATPGIVRATDHNGGMRVELSPEAPVDREIVTELLRRLLADGIAIERVSPVATSLEERFLTMTTQLKDRA
jgi:putative multiple sugar transport system ATP-binding protein